MPRLTANDRALILTKHHANRLSFAVLLAFFRERGRFPRRPTEIERALVNEITAELRLASAADLRFPLSGRSIERHRAEIRELLGFREATVADSEALTEWLQRQTAATGANAEQLTQQLEGRCRALFLEPPAPDRVDRIVRAAIHAHDERLQVEIAQRLGSETRQRLEALLRPDKAEAANDGGAGVGTAPALLLRLRGNPGRPSLAAIQDELAKLKLIREIGLPSDLFEKVLPHELDRLRRRVLVEAPYEIRRHPETARLTWLAAFVYLRGRSLTDDLVDLLIETIHHIGARAERKVERELLDDLRRLSGKQNLLFQVADASLDQPDGRVRDVVFPVVGEQTLRDLVKEWKATGPTYRTALRTIIRNSYKGHYRRMVPEILERLEFRSNNEHHRPVIEALELLKRFAGSKAHGFPPEETVPVDGVVRGLWREAVIETEADGRSRVNRITYEICVLEALRDRLRCKEIWIVGADRNRNPDDDLPSDFDAQQEQYYQALDLPLDPGQFIAKLQNEMRLALQTLDDGLPSNPLVRVTPKKGGQITVTPFEPQPEPPNLTAIKTEMTGTWPMTSLLDMVKEADLRLNFTDALKSPTAYESLGRSVLRPRLLLCLHGIGTNAGLQRMAGLHSGVTQKDLAYVRGRYLTVEALRRAVSIVTNGTLGVRNPAI